MNGYIIYIKKPGQKRFIAMDRYMAQVTRLQDATIFKWSGVQNIYNVFRNHNILMKVVKYSLNNKNHSATNGRLVHEEDFRSS